MPTEVVFWVFGVVLFWASIVGAVAVLCDTSPSAYSTTRSSEEELLFESFARGEIDDEEYRHHRQALRGGVHPAATSPS